MNNPIDRIKSLIGSLPKKDISFGYKFLEERDFESLQELINSALYKINKSLNSDNPKEEYLKINLEDLNSLKAKVDIYSAQIGFEDEDIESDLDYDESEIEENYY